uniref:Uncharacterized protein n=1 Tax=Amphimedon queenslandica TaxID=400682 RepID=A0A1X7TWM4_AMPQE
LLKGVINTDSHLSHNIIQLKDSIDDILPRSNTTLLHFYHLLSTRLSIFVQNESIHVI